MNPALRKQCLAELTGTFVIVFAPCALSGAGRGNGGFQAASWVSGLAVMAMVYAMGPISAAHFNPAVTLGFTLAGRFPRRILPAYWAAQLTGGILAAGVVTIMFGPGFGAHVPASGAGIRAAALESMLTFMLMLVIMAVATDCRTNPAIPGLAIGLTVVMDVMIGGPISGGSMNPVRSLGPAIFAGSSALASVWVYFAGPVTGAAFAAWLYERLRLDSRHAVSAPADLPQTAPHPNG